MQLLDIYCDNLYSFKELDLDFTKYENGTTIILGKNVNMDSSNGAGKSSILKSIYFALWGSDLNKVPLDGIINDSNPNQGCLSKIRFRDEKNVYTITRFKNYKNPDSKITLKDGTIPKGSAVELQINDEVFYAPKDNNKIEKLVLGVLGMSPEIFLNSVLTGQKRTENFLSSPDSSKKELLSEILDLSQYDEAATNLDKEIKEKKELLNNKESKINEFQKFMEKTHDDLKDLKNQANTYNNDLKIKITNRNDELKSEIDKLTQIKSKTISSIDTTKMTLDLLELETTINNNLKFLKEIDPLRDKITKLQINKQVNISSKENNEKSIKEIQSTIDDKCSLIESKLECELDFKNINTKINELELTLIESKKIEQDLSKLELNLNSLLINLTKKNSEKEEENSKLKTITFNLNKTKQDNKCFTCEREFDNSNPLIDKLSKELSTSNIASQSINKEIIDLEKMIDEIKKSIHQLKESYNSFKTKIEEKESLIIQKSSLQNTLDKIKENELFIEKSQLKIIELQNLLETNTININKIDEELIKLVTIQNQLNEINNKNQDLLTQKDVLQKSLHEIEKSNTEFNSQSTLIQQYELNIKKIEQTLEELKNGKNPYLELISKKTNELKLFETNYNNMSEEIKTLNDKFKLLKFWEQGFSKNGIKSFIIDEVIILLNLKLKEYLKILSGGNVSLFFEPEKVVKKHGTTKNEITTMIYINGKLKHPNSPSGGEEDRLTLAVDLALSDIAESRSGTKFNIKFLDEPFKWVDNKGQMKALALFNELSSYRQGFFLISHDEKMQSFCNNTIYVVNENGISRIVDKETFLNLK